MKSTAEVLQLRQHDQKTDLFDQERIVDIEKEILDKWVRRKKEAYWEIGRLLCEARPMYAYKKEAASTTLYIYIYIYSLMPASHGRP